MPTSSSGRGVLPRYAHGQLWARSQSLADDASTHSPPRKSSASSPARRSASQSPDTLVALRNAKLHDEDDENCGLSRENSCSSTEDFIRQQTLHHIRKQPASKSIHDTFPRKDVAKKSSPLTPSKADLLAKEALESVKKHLQSKSHGSDRRDSELDIVSYSEYAATTVASPPSKQITCIRAPCRSVQERQAQHACDEDQVEREVAAIIIQTYWRRWTAWKLQVRKAAESTMLQRLLDSSNGAFSILADTQDLKQCVKGKTHPTCLCPDTNVFHCIAATWSWLLYQAAVLGLFSLGISILAVGDAVGGDLQGAAFIEQATKLLLGLTSQPGLANAASLSTFQDSLVADKQASYSQEHAVPGPAMVEIDHQYPESYHNDRQATGKHTSQHQAGPCNKDTAMAASSPIPAVQHGTRVTQESKEQRQHSAFRDDVVANGHTHNDTALVTAGQVRTSMTDQHVAVSISEAQCISGPSHTSISVGVVDSEAADEAYKSQSSKTNVLQSRIQARSSITLSTDKLKSILDYLDTADQQADAEALAILPEDSVAHHQQQQHPHYQQEVSAATQPRPLSRTGGLTTAVSRHHAADTRDDVSVSGSSDIGSALSAGNKSAMLAESVFTTFKSKMDKLKKDVKQRDEAIVGLHKEIESLQQQFENELAAGEARLHHQLDLQRQEYETTTARHLGFIDRLLADKDELSKNCHTLMDQVSAMQQKQEKAVVSMQEGWAAELKRHKEAWAAAEKVKREQWAEAKTAEIKEITIKGLEHEVQSLLAKHKTDIAQIQDHASADTKRQLDALSTQHETTMRQLREKMCREQEDLLDRERAATQSRLREAAERYEQQLQSQRLRLLADQDMRMDQLQAQQREERRRLEEGAERAAREVELREKQLLEDFAREKDATRRAHEKQLEELRQQQDMQQQGWKDAVMERTRRELAQREAKLREALKVEQQEELQVVIQRLETEADDERNRAEGEFRQKELALVAKHNAAVKELKKSEARLAEKFRLAAESGRAAEERASAAEQHLSETRKELQAKNDRLKWFEDQLSKADDKERQHADDIRATAALKEAAYQDKLDDAQTHIMKLSHALEHAMKEVEEVKVCRERDMEYLDRRVKATLAKKEERIQELQDKLAAMERDNRQTAAMLTQLHQDYQLTDK